MSERTVALKIRNGIPLKVPRSLLTEDSRMFRYLIDELNYSELEMDDFSSEAVNLFLELLPIKEVKNIENVLFRELHKMAVVFEVNWLKVDCRCWLQVEITSITSDQDKEFLFEECWYIFKKWKEGDLMTELTSRIRNEENSCLISKYLSDIEKLETAQVDLLIELGGGNAELFLRNILNNLVNHKTFGVKIKYSLQKMNLALGFEQNEELYLKVFDTIANLPGISIAELRFCHKLRSETMRSVHLRKKKTSCNSTGVVYDKNVYNDLINRCRTLGDIINEVSNDQITSMFVVVELLLRVFAYSTPEESEIKLFVSSLEFINSKKQLHKIARQYVNNIISALAYSHLKDKYKLLDLIKEINRNDELSTDRDSVLINCRMKSDRVLRAKMTKKGLTYFYENEQNRMYTFKHPGVVGPCVRKGVLSKCGFVLKTIEREGNWIIELYKEDTDTDHNYKHLEIHCHEIISASEMFWYYSETAMVDDCEITVAGRMWWKEWLDHIDEDDWLFENAHVAYNVAGYWVAR